MLFRRSALPLPRRTLHFLAQLIRRHRRAAGSSRRKFCPVHQTPLTSAHLRKGKILRDLTALVHPGSGAPPEWRMTSAWRLVATAALTMKQIVQAKEYGTASTATNTPIITARRRTESRCLFTMIIVSFLEWDRIHPFIHRQRAQGTPGSSSSPMRRGQHEPDQSRQRV